MADLRLVDDHRDEVSAIADAAVAESLNALRAQDFEALSPEAFAMDVAAVGYDYASMAASAGADFYSEIRHDAGLRGYTAKSVPEFSSAKARALARWSIGPLYADPDLEAAESRLRGGMQRLVADADRATVAANAERDPARVRWYRAASAKACAFCAMLATRSAVYRSSASALRSHSHCRCLAVPVFPGESANLPSHYADFAQEYISAREAVTAGGKAMTSRNILAAWRGATERA